VYAVAAAIIMHTTPVSLLARMRQPANQDAWRRFVRIYTPLLHYWAQRTGLPLQDADDLVQEVFLVLAREMPRFDYDPQRSFRGWLRTVAVNQWNALRRHRQIPAQPLADVEPAGTDADPGELLAGAEFEQMVYRRALDIMQADFPGATWQACKAVVVDGKSAAEAAQELGMTIGAVRAARFRVLARLREELAGLA
jgi:RNA polymerase sigma-70 factor (ECF subfamily)